MPGLSFESSIDKGFEKDLKRMNSEYNKFSSSVERENDAISKSFNKLALGVTTAFSVGALVNFGRESVDLYRQQAKALAQVEQGLLSTNNAAGKTFEDLKKEASDLQKNTLFGDEEILQGATAQLLTFTNIAGDNFTRTQKVALDLATRLDGDLKSASIQLGKALNDPVANLSALSRSGIQFSEEQKDLIKTLSETGRLAEAQTVILAELERQYGGSAAAAAKADGGFTQLSNSIGDVREVLGSVIVEGLQPFIEEMQEFLNNLSEDDIRNFIENVKDGAEIIGILITALVAWKAALLITNRIQKINTAITQAARLEYTLAGKSISKSTAFMAAANKQLVLSFNKLKVAFASNPIGLLVTGLTLAIPLIQSFTKSQDDTIKKATILEEISNKQNEALGKEVAQLGALTTALKESTKGSSQRKDLITQINNTYGTTLKNLENEADFVRQIDAAYISIINNLKRKYALQTQEEQLTELISQELFATQQLTEARAKLAKIEKEQFTASESFTIQSLELARKEVQAAEAVVEGIIAKQKKLTENTNKTISELDKSIIKSTKTGTPEEYDKTIKGFEKLLSTQKKSYEEYNKSIEGLSGERLTVIKNEYSNLIAQGKTYLEFLNNLLEDEKDAKKRTIIKREIDVTTLQNTILEQKAAQELFDKQKQDLKELEEAFRNYSQKREVIEKEYNDKILTLRQAGYEAQAVQAEKALQIELQRLEESILSQNALFQKWVSTDLPKIAKQGVEAIRNELDKVDIALRTEGLDPEQVVVYRKQIKLLQEELEKKLDIEKGSPIAWKDTLEILNGVNKLISDLSNSFVGLDESTKKVLQSVTQTAAGVLNMISAFKALNDATTALERASAVLAIISATLQVINVVSNIFRKDQEERRQAYIEELKRIQAVNVELVRQNALYREGNELFAEDRWGTALAGLDAYNEALTLHNDLLDNVLNAEVVVGRERTGEFIWQDIIDKYPDVVDAFGNVDIAILETILATEEMKDETRVNIQSLIESVGLLEETFAQFGNFISGIFGGVAGLVTEAFQEMYEGGADAMNNLEKSFSDMIEQFTREALEFAFLQPYINELNIATKVLGEQYARGEVTAQELQANIINTLGSFYNQMASLQPEILAAFENADKIAEAAGFATAFDPQDTQDVLVEPNIIVDVTDPEQVSIAGVVQQAITEETGTILAGRIGAIVLSNERILTANLDLIDFAVQNLVYQKAIKENTDYLPEIAQNTKRTYEKLENI